MGFPGTADRDDPLRHGRARHAARRDDGDDRRGDARQPRAPHLLEPRRLAGHPRPRPADRCRPLHACRRRPDHHGRDAVGRRHGLSTSARRGRSASPGGDGAVRLRPQLGPGRRRAPPRPTPPRAVAAVAPEPARAGGPHHANPASRSTPAASSTSRSRAWAARTTGPSAASPSNRRSSPTARTSRTSPTRCCARATSTGR